MNVLISLIINFICGIIVVVWHEFPKNLVEHYLLQLMYRGRLKLRNPLTYIDPIGMIMFIFSVVGIGWQRPYKYNTERFKLKGEGGIVIALVGQLASLLLVFALLPLIGYMYANEVNIYLLQFTGTLAKFSLALFLVNLIPLEGFDMTLIINAFSYKVRRTLEVNQPYLKLFFVVLIVTRAIPRLVIYIIYVLEPLYRIFM